MTTIVFGSPVRGKLIYSRHFNPETEVHPVNGKLTRHGGSDISTDKDPTVLSIADGQIIATSENVTVDQETGKEMGWGLYTIVKHSESVYSLYAHLSRIDAHVGTAIRRGQSIAMGGATGGATREHLHLEVFSVPAGKTVFDEVRRAVVVGSAPAGRVDPRAVLPHPDDTSDKSHPDAEIRIDDVGFGGRILRFLGLSSWNKRAAAADAIRAELNTVSCFFHKTALVARVDRNSSVSNSKLTLVSTRSHIINADVAEWLGVIDANGELKIDEGGDFRSYETEANAAASKAAEAESAARSADSAVASAQRNLDSAMRQMNEAMAKLERGKLEAALEKKARATERAADARREEARIADERSVAAARIADKQRNAVEDNTTSSSHRVQPNKSSPSRSSRLDKPQRLGEPDRLDRDTSDHNSPPHPDTNSVPLTPIESIPEQRDKPSSPPDGSLPPQGPIEQGSRLG